MPDALSKTIPLWCAVINEAIKSQRKQKGEIWGDHWDLHTPPTCVSPSEHEQMRQLIPGLAANLLNSSFHLHSLNVPLRPFWVTPRSTPHTLPTDCFPVVCVSASKQVEDGMERRSHTYSYVQGAADDHESWSMVRMMLIVIQEPN